MGLGGPADGETLRKNEANTRKGTKRQEGVLRALCGLLDPPVPEAGAACTLAIRCASESSFHEPIDFSFCHLLSRIPTNTVSLGKYSFLAASISLSGKKELRMRHRKNK